MTEVGAIIAIDPIGLELAVQPDQTLMQAALAQGLRWPTVCGGNGTCTVCFVRVVEGHDALVPAEAAERQRLSEVGRDSGHFRLACQLRVTGDARVEKRGVRRPIRGSRAGW